MSAVPELQLVHVTKLVSHNNQLHQISELFNLFNVCLAVGIQLGYGIRTHLDAKKWRHSQSSLKECNRKITLIHSWKLIDVI